ncbi:hypothetical protein PQX77_005294 [Marasmius sp. AFHP31]|nr:hypothetical protein PQX77_005294 [Marasmius sp. AFHP31]
MSSYSLKHTQYHDQNQNPHSDPPVAPVIDKKRQPRRIYKYAEDHTIPAINVRSPKPGDEMYRLPFMAQDTSSASLCFPSRRSQYQPSLGVMELIRRYAGPGIWPNLYPRNSWELLEPFEHGLAHRNAHDLGFSPSFRPGSGGNVPETQDASSTRTSIVENTWNGGPYIEAESLIPINSEDCMAIDPALLYDGLASSNFKACNINRREHMISHSPTSSSAQERVKSSSDSFATKITTLPLRVPYPFEQVALKSLDSSPLRYVTSSPMVVDNNSASLSMHSSSSSPPLAGISSNACGSSPASASATPLVSSSPPSSVSAILASPRIGGLERHTLRTSYSTPYQIADRVASSPTRPASRRRPRTSLKRRASSPGAESSPDSFVRRSKRTRLSE